MSRYLLEHAVLAAGAPAADRVLVEIDGGRFTRVDTGADPAATAAEWIPGLTVPGLANGHSHAFHRALRGHTQRERGTFWTWREQMYALASRLDPDSYLTLATAVFAEMVAAGYTAVGEFHYVHHDRSGRPYADPNAMGLALAEAASRAGIRLTLLDGCYLSSGFGAAPEGVQRRFTDGDADRWAHRHARLREGLAEMPGVTVGTAVHSVRAVPADRLATVAAAAAGEPLHVHLSEQRAENDACLARYGLTPAALLDEHGVLGPLTTLVHATHLTDDDLARLGAGHTFACFCATTERDLGDGIGPSRRLHDAGVRLTIGSDSHAVVDPFEEMRAIELDERLATEQRGHWTAAELLAAGTRHHSLGVADAGRIAIGQRADLVTLDPCSPRTAGTGAGVETAVFAATGADVVRTVVDGRTVFERGDEPEVGCALDAAISALRA